MYELKFADYGQLKDLDATDGELAVFDELLNLISVSGQDPSRITLVRKSRSYLTAQLGPTDVMRFKWSDKTHWIELPYDPAGRKKIPIDDPQDLRDHIRMILGHFFYATAHVYLGYE